MENGSKVRQSLFVVSLPRSLSSFVFHKLRIAANLNEPVWTSDGEVLNLDRYALFQGSAHDTCRKYIHGSMEPELFARAVEYLDQLFIPTGFAYKDVVQPFVAATWLRRNRVTTIRIKRDILDVAYSMLGRRWYYPGRLYPDSQSPEAAVIQGLTFADQILDSIPSYTIHFDDLVTKEESLNDALSTLYGHDVSRCRIRYIDDSFRRTTEQISKRRDTEQYRLLANLATRHTL